MAKGASDSKTGAVEVYGVAGCTTSIAVPWVATAAGVGPTRVLRNRTV